MAKKRPAKSKKPFARMKTSGFLHWVRRLKSEESPIQFRKLEVLAESPEEAAKISVCVALLSGTASPSLQKEFEKESQAILSDFEKKYPNYEYSIGGPQKVA
jgi:hypothetical protein